MSNALQIKVKSLQLWQSPAKIIVIYSVVWNWCLFIWITGVVFHEEESSLNGKKVQNDRLLGLLCKQSPNKYGRWLENVPRISALMWNSSSRKRVRFMSWKTSGTIKVSLFFFPFSNYDHAVPFAISSPQAASTRSTVRASHLCHLERRRADQVLFLPASLCVFSRNSFARSPWWRRRGWNGGTRGRKATCS